MRNLGELRYDEALDGYLGQDDEWRVSVTAEAWREACRIMTVRGISRRSWLAQLHAVTTWYTDATLRDLDGVETTQTPRSTLGDL